MAELQQIGKLGKTHGYKGAIRVILDPGFAQTFSRSKAFFIEIKGEKIPYFFTIISEFSNDSCIVELEEVTTKEAAQKFTGKDIFLPVSKKVKPVKNESLEGYMLKDENLGEVGIIREITEMPHQLLAVVDYKEKEIYIPLHTDFVLKIDNSRKVLYVNLPEGILEI